MCGIAGAYDPQGRVDLTRLQRMSHLLRHRGPDDEGIALLDPRGGRALTLAGPDTPEDVIQSPYPYAPGRFESRDGNGGGSPLDVAFSVGLVTRRLAIVDLSPAGHGPMCDGSRDLWIAYNGEVYNYVELRAELQALGDHFTTATDTEVVLAAYRALGHGLSVALQRHVRVRAVGREAARAVLRARSTSASSRSTIRGRAGASRSPPNPRRSCSRSRDRSASAPTP